MIDTNTYPALGFNFKVTSADAALGGMVGYTFGVNSPGNDKLDSFQSVSGLGAKMDVDPLSNGGLNNINYKVTRKKKKHCTGAITTMAIIRGTTRYSTGSVRSIVMASICSVTFMVPSWAA